MAKKIVLVEDEPDIAEVLSYNLQREGFEVFIAEDGLVGLNLIKAQMPDLALIDLMLPSMDGLEICQKIRANEATANIPVIMLTAKGEESDIVLGLGLGADDYVCKPFSPKEVIARIKAQLRRSEYLTKTSNAQELSIEGLCIDTHKHKVIFNEKELTLTATEFRLLHYFAKNPGQVFSREQLINNAYSNDVVVVDRNIDVHIRAIRKKIGEEYKFIETIRGIGYRFKEGK